MKNFADRLIREIERKGNPCMVGLDPRIEMMPYFVIDKFRGLSPDESIQKVIIEFNLWIIQQIKNIIPAVKLQIAFYEQYGVPGIIAFKKTIEIAKEAGLQVVVDAKRNDIGSTAQAYANALLGRTNIYGSLEPIFDVDCITVSPFLGRDSILPFVETCLKYGKGIFILVKTSNPGSVDIQDAIVKNQNAPLYTNLARMVQELAEGLVGETGYSSIGAVVGATFPEEAHTLRKLMPKSIFLVPGYGAQGGTAADTIPCFNSDKRGAIINASRSITFSYKDRNIDEQSFADLILSNTTEMIKAVNSAVGIKNETVEK